MSPIPVPTGYVLPHARVELLGGRVLPGAGPVLDRSWRVALAAELAGLLDAGLMMTSAYLAQRTQFGRPLGSLQALQHRLAEAYVWVEGTRWAARSAAWHGDEESAATAATYAVAQSLWICTSSVKRSASPRSTTCTCGRCEPRRCGPSWVGSATTRAL